MADYELEMLENGVENKCLVTMSDGHTLGLGDCENLDSKDYETLSTNASIWNLETLSDGSHFRLHAPADSCLAYNE